VSLLREIAQRLDAWVNPVAGLGDPATDKGANWSFQPRSRISDEVLARAYEQDDVVATVASAVPDAELGRGYEIDSATDGRLHALEEGFDALGYPTARDVFRSARTWEELFGGAAILIGAQDGRRVEEPLDEGRVRRVDFLLDLDPRECRPDVSYQGAGRPTHYRVQVGGYGRLVHASRLIVFPGLPLPRRERRVNHGWGASRVRRAWEAIQDFHASWAGARHQLVDGSQPVWRIKDLAQMIAGGQSDAIRERVRLAEYTRSVTRAILLDHDNEAFERRDASMTGLAPVLDQNFVRLALAIQIPVEVLLGRAPAGLNSAGTFPLQLWYGRVEGDRDLSLRPRVERAVDVLARSLEGPFAGRPPDDWKLVLRPLGQTTDREDAEVDEIRIRTLGAAVDRFPDARAEAEAKARAYLDLGPATVAVPALVEPERGAPRLQPPPAAPSTETEGIPTSSPGVEQEAPPRRPERDLTPENAVGVDPNAALNGAQVSSMLEIVNLVASRQLPRDMGVRLIASAFPLTEQEADALLGETGRTWFLAVQPDDPGA
jgi:phage-related protein (TIGR01555 family)